ncbi:MAG: DUF4097 family beta strand repeat-containing protein, partial [Lachnospiraceae bacterium]|nr:DUF4097 family beta strand repeat-containing protein [Lachnospiraceae bacterium]
DWEAEDRDAEGRGSEDWNSETDRATEADRKHFSQVKEMDLQIGGGTLTIKTGEESGDSIQVSCKDWASRKDWYQVSCEDGTLEVEVKGKSGRHPEVEIIVPADYALEEASIHMAAGSCRIAALDAAELEVDCAAGEVDIQNGSAGEASFQCSAGKIIYQGQIHGAAEGDCSAGSIHLKLLQDEKDFNYSVNGGGGAVTVGGWSVSGAVLRQEINNGAEQDMELDCVAGNIQVEFSKNEG